MTSSPTLPPHVHRRNFTLGVANGTLVRLFDTLAHPSLVLTWFVAQWGASPLVIGLLVPIANGGWFLPQPLMSAAVHRMPRKMWLYHVASVVRVAALSSTICAPFYTLFARKRLGAPLAMAGTYVGAFTLALIGSTLLWGRVSERWGNRVVVWRCGLLSIPAPLLTLLPGPRLSYTAFTAVPALLAAAQTGTDIGFLSLGPDLAPAAERPLYLGFLNTVLVVISFALVVGGWIVTRWGLETVFGISLGFALLWFVMAGALRQPEGISPA